MSNFKMRLSALGHSQPTCSILRKAIGNDKDCYTVSWYFVEQMLWQGIITTESAFE